MPIKRQLKTYFWNHFVNSVDLFIFCKPLSTFVFVPIALYVHLRSSLYVVL